MEVIVIAIVIGLIPAYIAKSKGRDFFSWWLYGALLFLIALIHSIILKDGTPTDHNTRSIADANNSTIKSPTKNQEYSKYAIVVIIVLVLIAYLFRDKEFIDTTNDSTSTQNTFTIPDNTSNSTPQTITQENYNEGYSDTDKKMLAKIKAKVKRDFPEDYYTQKMMFDQEIEAYFYMKTVTDLKIKKNVERDYPLDFFTQKMMYNQQIDAKEQMK